MRKRIYKLDQQLRSERRLNKDGRLVGGELKKGSDEWNAMADALHGLQEQQTAYKELQASKRADKVIEETKAFVTAVKREVVKGQELIQCGS